MADQAPAQAAAQEFASSPLLEADPSSLEELFARDPLKLSEADLDRIIEAERAFRAKLASQPEKAPRQKAAAIPKEKVSASALLAAMAADDEEGSS
jgi:hypothetical protein